MGGVLDNVLYLLLIFVGIEICRDCSAIVEGRGFFMKYSSSLFFLLA